MKPPGGLKLLSMLRSWIWLLPLCPPRKPPSRSQNSSPKRPCKHNCIAGGREEAALDERSQVPRPRPPARGGLGVVCGGYSPGSVYRPPASRFFLYVSCPFFRKKVRDRDEGAIF